MSGFSLRPCIDVSAAFASTYAQCQQTAELSCKSSLCFGSLLNIFKCLCTWEDHKSLAKQKY